MIHEKIENKGAKFYLEVELAANDFNYSIKCHVKGETEDIILHKGIKKPGEAVRQLEYYAEKYSGFKAKDAIADSDIEIDRYIDRYKQILEYSREKLIKKPMKGADGLVELCKQWGIQYSKLSKEQCVEEIIKKVEESFSYSTLS